MTTLADFETLEEAQAYSYVTYKDMSTSEMNAYLGAYGLISYVKNLTDEKGLALQETLAANGNFCFDESDTIGLSNLNYIDELIAKEDEYTDHLSALKLDLVEYCKSDETFPFASSTQVQFNQANSVYTSAEIEWPASNKVKISIANNEHRCPVTFYGKSDDFDDWQNLGKAIYLTTAGVSKNLASEHVYTQLKVTVPLKEVEITIEVV